MISFSQLMQPKLCTHLFSRSFVSFDSARLDFVLHIMRTQSCFFLVFCVLYICVDSLYMSEILLTCVYEQREQ
jgi:hypothetical protein